MAQYTYIDSDIVFTDEILLELMEFTRKVVSVGLRLRAKSGIKVRQPLSKMAISAPIFFHDDLIEIIKEAVNVKEVIFIDDVDDIEVIDGDWVVLNPKGEIIKIKGGL